MAPYRSQAQKRFFKMCEKTPGRAKDKCPPRKVLKEYSAASKRKK
jgi:hypothetical protein